MIGLTYTEYLQRYGATREAMAPVVVEARKNGARIPWSYWHDRPLAAAGVSRLAHDRRPDLPARLRHPGRRRGGLRLHLGGAGPGPASPARLRLRVRQRSPTRHRLPLHWPLDDIMRGRRDGPAAVGAAGIGPGEVDLPQVYDGFSPFVYFWMEVLGLCPVGEAHRFVQDGGIDSDRRGHCRCSRAAARSATDACTASRRCSSATCSCRGARANGSASGVSIGLACHSSPHFGGAVVYSATRSSGSLG